MIRSRANLPTPPLTILVWHLHGSWLESFIAGRHVYRLAIDPAREDGRRRAHWPPNVIETPPQACNAEEIDIVVFQHLSELASVRRWIGSRRIPAIYVEHNAPQGRINDMRHPLADRDDLAIVHVTHFNALFWDTGATPTRVIEHGIPDPGYRYDGRQPRAAVVINEAARRGRVTGTDLLDRFAREIPLDLFGIGSGRDLAKVDLHAEMSLRRLYLHPYRWTSLGLSLLEAMMLGMPVVTLATTEAPRAVPCDAGICTCDLDAARAAIRRLLDDPERARAMGRAARAHALEHYSIELFLATWDDVLLTRIHS